MKTIYHCVTGNWLPNTKCLFNSYFEVKNHIYKVLDEYPDKLTEEQKLFSIRVVMIDKEEAKNYRDIFLEGNAKKPIIKRKKKPNINSLNTPQLLSPTQ